MGTDKTAYARKTKSTRTTSVVGEGDFAPFRGYINLSLSDEEKKPFDAWAQSEDMWLVLELQIADGVGVAIKLDPKGNGYLASATQRRAGSPNAGLCVTARGGSAYVSLARLVFSLAILTRSPNWEDTQKMADPDRW